MNLRKVGIAFGFYFAVMCDFFKEFVRLKGGAPVMEMPNMSSVALPFMFIKQAQSRCYVLVNGHQVNSGGIKTAMEGVS